MPSGAPDWQNRLWRQEITLRHDQLLPSGKVIFTDDFSEPWLGWNRSGVGSEVIVVSTREPHTPPGKLLMQTGVNVNDTANILKELGITTGEKIGLQTAFARVTVKGDLYFEIASYDGTTELKASIKYDTGDSQWEYEETADNYVVLSDGAQALNSNTACYHRLKLVVDFDSGKYVKLFVNEREWDLSSNNLLSTASATLPELTTRLEVINVGGAPFAAMHIDNLFLTEED